MNDTASFVLVLVLIFIMGMVAAWVVRLMIHKEVVEEVDNQLDERGIVRRKGKPQ